MLTMNEIQVDIARAELFERLIEDRLHIFRFVEVIPKLERRVAESEWMVRGYD